MKKKIMFNVIFLVLLFAISVVYSGSCWRVYEGPSKNYSGKMEWHIECLSINTSVFVTHDDANVGKYWVSPYFSECNRGFNSLEAAANCGCKCN